MAEGETANRLAAFVKPLLRYGEEGRKSVEIAPNDL